MYDGYMHYLLNISVCGKFLFSLSQICALIFVTVYILVMCANASFIHNTLGRNAFTISGSVGGLGVYGALLGLVVRHWPLFERNFSRNAAHTHTLTHTFASSA